MGKKLWGRTSTLSCGELIIREIMTRQMDFNRAAILSEKSYSEQAMVKVYTALEAAGLTNSQILDTVNQLQSRGILFRERDRG